jgi:hypothetical protein
MATEEKKAPEISQELKDAKIKVVKLNSPGPFMFGGNRHDTTVMKATTAKRLMAEGCPYLAYEEDAAPNKAQSPAVSGTARMTQPAAESTSTQKSTGN